MSDRAVRIATHHPAFAGHFPGQPVLPGVALLAEVLEAVLDEPALAASIGQAPRVAQVKFLAPVRPGTDLCLALQASGHGVRFALREGERTVASGVLEAGA
jgi:3-hydroxyacyl-[acyl-carrier-protein] dehydratase